MISKHVNEIESQYELACSDLIQINFGKKKQTYI